MRTVTGGPAWPSRWVWAVSGLVTAAVLVLPGAHFIGALLTGPLRVQGGGVVPQSTLTRTLTVAQPVTSLTVQSYGGPVLVTTGSVRRVQVSERITYDPQAGGAPAVTESVSGGRLFLADPDCLEPGPNGVGCTVSFVLTVPPGLSVTAVTDSGPLTVTGTAGANLDSGGGPVRATGITGPLTVSTANGPLLVQGLTGPLRADTGGGPLVAQGLDAATVVVTTDGGSARIGFAVAPESVSVSTASGPAVLTVPGGPYALTADSGGGPESVSIATTPTAPRSITVSTNGGPLQIAP